jgi:hypothetical protein
VKPTTLLLLICITIISATEPFIIGYIPSYRISALDKMDISGLTHVIAAFSNPDSSGTISSPFDMELFSQKVRDGGAKPVASIGGGGSYSWGADTLIYSHLYADSNRTMFVDSLIAYSIKYNLSGIDVDIEGTPLMNENYDIFVRELADSLHANNLEIYSAYGVDSYAGASYADDETLLKFDIIGTMSYGGVDSWNWNTPSNKATFDKFKNDIQYFISRGVSPSKIAGGVPFYSVGFPKEQQSNYNGYYHTLEQLHSDSFYIAQVPFYNDTLINRDSMVEFGNSFPTIKKKLDYAKSIGGGVMIWELGQDNYRDGPNMLDSMIAHTKDITSISTLKNSNNSKLKLSKSGLSFNSINGYSLSIFDIRGREIISLNKSRTATINFNKLGLSTGVYILSIKKNKTGEDITQSIIIR